MYPTIDPILKKHGPMAETYDDAANNLALVFVMNLEKYPIIIVPK